MTFSPSTSSLVGQPLKHHLQPHMSFHMMPGGSESGYGSGFSLSRPLESFDASSLATSSHDCGGGSHPNGEVQTTPRTTAAINYMSALQLSTPRTGMRSNRKGTPLKRQQPIFNHSNIFETTPKKCKSHENNENHGSSFLSRSGSMKMPFRSRLDRSLSQTMSPLAGNGCAGGNEKLDCTFDAISSSTPICQPFRAEFYEQQVEEIPFKMLPRSGGKNTRTKLIRKMQSFSPRKLMGLRGAKVPLREMDQNSVDFQTYSSGLFPVEEEAASPIPKERGVKKVLFSDTVTTVGGGTGVGSGAFSSGLRDLMFGKIKTCLKDGDQNNSFGDLETTNILSGSNAHQNVKTPKEVQETSSNLLDIYVTNLSNLDGGDSNSHSADTEDGDVSMNTSMVADVEKYFDELKRNTTQLQEDDQEAEKVKFVPLVAKDSLDLHDMVMNEEAQDVPVVEEEEQQMAVEQQQVVVEERPPMLLRKRKRPSTELIQAVLATPKKMRRSQSFHMGDGGAADENSELWDSHRLSDASGDHLSQEHMLSPMTQQRIGGARKRLNYEPVPRNRCSPAKRALAFDGVQRRRTLVGTNRINIFRHLANCPPVRDYFFDFVDDKDLVAIYAVNRQCKRMIEEHPRLNGRRLKYLEAAWRKKENYEEVHFTTSSSTTSLSPHTEELTAEKSLMRSPLHNRNVDTSCLSVNETMSPPVSPSRRKFHENQKLVQRNPGAFFVSCPRCRSSSVIERVINDGTRLHQSHLEEGTEENSSVSFRSMRSMSMCASDLGSRNTSLMIPVRKQFSLPESSSLGPKEQQRMGTCQSIQCGFKFCVHCSYAFEPGHKCIEIGTLSPLIKQSKQPRVVACSKQSKRNLKRL